MPNTIIPIFSSRGDADAFLMYPYLFNRQGEWIGFVTAEREVFSVLGFYVGTLTRDPRILRKRSQPDRPRVSTPPAPARIRIPSGNPMPRMMGDVPFELLDVLQDDPGLLHTLDAGEFRADLD